MKESQNVAWIRNGAICGLASAALYISVATLPLPQKLSFAVALSFGPLAVIFWIGIYRFVKLHQDSLLLQSAVLFGMAGGLTVTLMLAVQITIHQRNKTILAKIRDDVSKDLLRHMDNYLASVHLGLDIAWDIFIGIATLLLGLAIFEHPKFGRVVGTITSILGLLILALNFASLPIPPAESGLFDVGPFAGVWFLVIFIQMLRSLDWVKNNQPAS